MNEAIERHPSLLPRMQCEDKTKEEHPTNNLERPGTVQTYGELLRIKMLNILAKL